MLLLMFVIKIDMAYASKHNGLNKNTIDERKSSSKLLLFILVFLCLCVCSLVFFLIAFILGSSDSFIGDARRLSEAGVRRSSGLLYHFYVKLIYITRIFNIHLQNI